MKLTIIPVMICLATLASAQSRVFDAALAWNEQYYYFTKDNIVVEYDNYNNKPLKTKTISETFPGMMFKKIDAILDYGNGKIYFFSGNEYARFDKASFKTEAGYPKSIAQNWATLKFHQFQAAISWPNGKSYFFKDKQYIRYDRATQVTDANYPKLLSSQVWPGLTFESIDAATLAPNGKAYFFKNDQYIRYDINLDKADEGYPKNISVWKGLSEALGGSTPAPNPVPNPTPNVTPSNNVSYKSFEIKNMKIDLSPYTLKSPNKVTYDFTLKKGVNGESILTFQQENDCIIMRIDKDGNRIGNAIELTGYWFSDLYCHSDGSISVLVGKDVNNDYIAGYPNTLYFIKISTNGTAAAPKYIFGGTGHGPGKSWFDGRSQAVFAYNGTSFGVYFEVQKNFAKPGGEQDIHNGDMFVMTDLTGYILPNSEQSWTASHSSTLKICALPNKEYLTMTIGDASPYGLQVFNRNEKKSFVAWPPKEDFVAYENCNSSNAPGILHFTDESEGNLIALLGTLEHPNISWNTKVDPLFLKMDKQGNILVKKYLKSTPDVHEGNISMEKIGKNYLVAFGPGNIYDKNWAPGDFEFCIIDNNANFLFAPTKIAQNWDNSSNLIPLDSKNFVWCSVASLTNELNFSKITFK